jgi:eukaryotic-like serine/threonine-protein kinase
VSRGTLFAVRFDLAKLETSGSPMPVLQQVSYSAMFGSAKLSFSRTGTLMYRSREIDTSRVVIQWMGADGKLQPLLDKPGLFVNPHSPPMVSILRSRTMTRNPGYGSTTFGATRCPR